MSESLALSARDHRDLLLDVPLPSAALSVTSLRRETPMPCRSLLLLLAAAVPLLSACGDGGTGPGASGPCTGNVSISVSAGTTPTFTWLPPCRVVALLVEQEASDMWFVEGTGDGIASGVQYGTVPPNGAADEPALPLVPGTTYEVILFRGTSLQDATLAGIREFTP
jgi:hypothetical protein